MTNKQLLTLALLLALNAQATPITTAQPETSHWIDMEDIRSADCQGSSCEISLLGKVRINPNPHKPVLGITDVRYDVTLDDGDDILVLTSSDAGARYNAYNSVGKPRIYRIEMKNLLRYSEGKLHKGRIPLDVILQVELQPDTPGGSHPLINGWLDPQALAPMRNGHNLIASQGASEGSLSLLMPWRKNIYPLLIEVREVGEQGYSTAEYEFPEHYWNNNWFRSGKGVIRHHGIKSLDQIPLSSDYREEFVAVTDTALTQDKDIWPREHGQAPSRILRFHIPELGTEEPSVDLKKTRRGSLQVSKEALYSFDENSLPESALHDASAISRGVNNISATVTFEGQEERANALILERSHITYNNSESKARAITQVFSVDLDSGSSIPIGGQLDAASIVSMTPVNKQLILSTHGFEEAIAEATRDGRNKHLVELKLGQLNIKGLTLGRNLPDGRKLLILVNDNNAQTVTQTYLLFFAVPENLL